MHRTTQIDTQIYEILQGAGNVVWQLLQNGADINVVNKKNYTALSLAIEKGLRSDALLLIENGADVNYVGNNDNTPVVRIVYHRLNKLF